MIVKILYLFILIFSGQVFAQGISLKKVDVNCGTSIRCNLKKTRLTNLIGDYRSLLHLKETLRIIASDGGYQTYSYNIYKENDLSYRAEISIFLKPLIEEVTVGTVDRNLDLDPNSLVNFKARDYFEEEKLDEEVRSAKAKLDALGFPRAKIKPSVIKEKNRVKIFFAITLGEPLIFKRIKTDAKSSFVDDFLKKKFLNFYDKPFELNRFKLHLDEAQKELFGFGYYLISLDFKPIYKKDRVFLDVKVTQDRIFSFDFKNISFETREGLLLVVRDLFKKYKRTLTVSALRSVLEDHYKHKSMLSPKVEIKTSNFKNNYNETVYHYQIFIEENNRTKVKKISFNGNSFFSDRDIRIIYEDEAFELANLDLYDEEYLNYFVGFLKSKYIEKGYIQVKVYGPNKDFSSDKTSVDIDYQIIEGQRTFTRNINFTGMPKELIPEALKLMGNKISSPFNPIALSDDIKKVSDLLQNNGYYFSEITNSNDSSFVEYSPTGTDVDIHFKVQAGTLTKLNRVIFLGNMKTKSRVIEKKIPISQGDIITPEITRSIESSLSATGLYTSVSVFPMRHTSTTNTSTDLIVRVVERDYGLIEIAPGYRTDLGLKLTGTVSYINVAGENIAVTLRSQVNQRLNNQTLNPQRRDQDKSLLEHNTTITYNQGDVFDTLIDFSASGSYQRKRFYPFDADIARANFTFSRDFTKVFSAAIRYQIEKISQFNALDEFGNNDPKDNGTFQIGAITPSLTFDLRNSATLPVSGAFFNMSVEFANPYFLSQKEPDLTVNYYKLVSRNRFYIPHKNGTIAISLVAGVQKNLATEMVERNGVMETEGYIPNIKVFRLTGMDIVRGFNDEEINRVPGSSRDDITDVRIADKAYLANFKFEPRYFINDNLMIGAFYDAGRVFVDKVDLTELRDSVGITFKILTPVGTLDFDYGIKLLREKNKDGSLEDPGRFHVSIGFF